MRKKTAPGELSPSTVVHRGGRTPLQGKGAGNFIVTWHFGLVKEWVRM
jgi:hypothetical protein